MLARVLKLLIAPFRFLIVNFYYGIVYILRGLVLISKYIVVFIASIFVYFFDGIIFITKNIIMMFVFLLKKMYILILNIFKIFIFIIKKILNAIYFFIKNIFLGIKYSIKFIIFVINKTIYFIIGVLKSIYYIFVKIFVTLWKCIKNIFIFLIQVIVHIYKFIVRIFKELINLIKKLIIGIYKVIKAIVLLIKKGIMYIYNSIKKLIIKIINAFKSIFIYIYKKVAMDFFVPIFNKIKLAINKRIDLIKKKLEEHRLRRERKREEKRQRLIQKRLEQEKKRKEILLKKEQIREEKRQKLMQKKLEKDRIRNEKREKLLEVRREKELAKKKIYLEKLERKNEKIKAKERKVLNEQESARKQKLKRKNSKEERREQRERIKKDQAETKQKNKLKKRTLKEKLVDWYNNLYFVKDIKNRKELSRQALLIDFEGNDAVRNEEKIMYKYIAKNSETGKVEKGMFAAFSKLDVHSYLLSENYEVYRITAVRKASFKFIIIKIKKSDLVFFLTQLSTFLKSGLPLVDSVKILEKQTKKRNYRNIYRSVIYELTMGENFSEALEKQGESFPKLLTNMIKTAELTGNLPETLDDMANYYQETEKTRKQMVSAMMYPMVILVFAVVVVIFILIYVIPEFVGIYGDMNAELPGITLFIINSSKFLQRNIHYVIIVIVLLAILFRVMYTTVKVFRTLMQWVFMHIPIMGKIIIYNEVTMFTKTFGSLLNHNVFITESMEVLSKITNNEIYKMIVFDTMTKISQGEPISTSFKNHWAFPIVAYEMLLTGEKTGQLGAMMDKVAVYYQEQHRVSVNQIKTFIEPVMIVFLTVVVGVILLSIILPMFSMYEIVG